MANLTNQFVSQSYQGLIKLEDSTQGLTGTLQPLTDGLDNPLPILVSTTDIIITGSFAGDGSNLTGITFDTSSIQSQIDSKLDSSSFENYTSSNDSKVNSLINATGSYLTELPDGLVSGSSQIVYSGITGIPTGSGGVTSYNDLTDIPVGIVSSSEQVSFTGITDKPALVSGSSQISYNGLTGIPTGIVSGSEQISFNGITDIPTGLVSGSEQISFNSISDVPDGLISGSIQISDLGYATTGSNTFNGDQIISGTLEVTGYITGDGSQLTGITFDSSSIVEQISTKLDSSSFESYTSSNDQKVNSLIQETGSYITNSQTGSMTVASSSHSEYAVTASFAMNGGGTPIDTSTFATTGSNTFNGNQIIKGSIEPTTIKGSSESSGNVWLDFNEESIGCTTPNPYLNQLTNGVNLIFPRRPEITSICSGIIEVSGSSNIILQGHLVEQSGRKGYLAGYGNFVQNVPTINTSSLATITMGNNYISNPPSLTYDSGTHFIASNVLVGGMHLNHVSASASPVGSYVQNNINTGTIISNASGSLLASSLSINNNIQAGTVTLRHIKTPIRYSNNMEVGSITVNNNFEGTGSQHFLDISNNFIGVSTGIVDAGGSSSTNVRRRVNDNFIGGNNVYLNLTESGSDAGNISSTLIFGNSLNVYGKQTLNGLDKGSAYLGRYNLDYGPTADPRQTIVAVGVGTSIANRKTGFWITSGSTVGIDGAMNVTGSLTLNGNIYQTGTVNTSDDYIYLRSDSTGSLETPFGYSGVVIKNINGVEDAKIVVDNQGWLYAGRIGEEQRMAPIVYSPTNNYLAYWNGSGYLDFIDPDTFAPANGSINNNFNTNDLFVAGTLSSSNPIDGTFTGDGTGLSITLPTGIVSSSSQISYTGITDVPSGLVSGSSQISYNGITDVPSGIVSSSAQISYTGITDVPSNLVSSSAQIELTGTTGFSTFSSSVSKDNIYQLYQPDKTNPFVYTDNSGALHIDGNIIQNGSSYETHAEKIYSTKDYIYLRSGSVAGLGAGEYTGIEAEKYDGVNNGRLVFDNQGWAKVGDVGSEQTLATRIDSPTNGYMAVWDDANKRLDFVQQYQLPAGVVSGSGQISFNGITDVPSGLVSGSSQIIYSGITGIPSGSGVSSFNDLTDVPSGLVSGSIQVNVAQTTGYNTLSTTGSNTFVGTQVVSGSLEGNVNAITISSNTGSMDCGAANFFTITLPAAATHILPANINKGQTINVLVTTTGGNTVTFPSSVKQQSGASYSPTNATGKDVLTFVAFDTTTIYLTNIKNLV